MFEILVVGFEPVDEDAFAAEAEFLAGWLMLRAVRMLGRLAFVPQVECIFLPVVLRVWRSSYLSDP